VKQKKSKAATLSYEPVLRPFTLSSSYPPAPQRYEMHYKAAVVPSAERVMTSVDAAFDLVVLDEGHKIKNPASKTYQALSAIPARARIVATGTIVQNSERCCERGTVQSSRTILLLSFMHRAR